MNCETPMEKIALCLRRGRDQRKMRPDDNGDHKYLREGVFYKRVPFREIEKQSPSTARGRHKHKYEDPYDLDGRR